MELRVCLSVFGGVSTACGLAFMNWSHIEEAVIQGMSLPESEEYEIFTSLDEDEDGELHRIDIQKFLNLLQSEEGPEETPFFGENKGRNNEKSGFGLGFGSVLNEYIKIQLTDDTGEETISAISMDFVDSLTLEKLEEMKKLESLLQNTGEVFPIDSVKKSKRPRNSLFIFLLSDLNRAQRSETRAFSIRRH